MAKVVLKATELTNTDVDFVALVKRGANRIPFRITKGDDTVLDLNKLGRRLFQKADPVPAIGAILTQKNEVDAALAEALKKACGLGEVRVSKDDSDLITIAGKDAKLDGAFLVKLDKNFAVAVVKSQMGAAFPGVEYANGLSAARKGFNETVKAAILKAETLADAKDAIVKAADEFSAYVTLFADNAPESVFKAEKALKTGTGNAEGAGATNQETGDGLGDKANGKGRASRRTRTSAVERRQQTDDPEMPPKNAKTGTRAAKADAGKNGTGAGFELSGEQGGDDSDGSNASRDNKDEAINAAPGGAVSGDSSGLPAKAKAPTKKEAHTWVAHDIPVQTVGESGEGARQAAETGEMDQRPENNADADDANAGGAVAGKRKGKTLDMSGVPAGAKAPTAKNDGDAEVGQKGKGKTLPDEQSGAGAQEKDVQTLKSEAAIMQAISALAKSVQDSNAAVSKSVSDLSARVDAVTVMAKKTDAALNGTVFNEEHEDRQVWTRKSAAPAEPPLLDTAYQRRSA